MDYLLHMTREKWGEYANTLKDSQEFEMWCRLNPLKELPPEGKRKESLRRKQKREEYVEKIKRLRPENKPFIVKDKYNECPDTDSRNDDSTATHGKG